MEIKKGKRYKCIAPVVSDGNFEVGEIYFSNRDGCIIDGNGKSYATFGTIENIFKEVQEFGVEKLEVGVWYTSTKGHVFNYQRDGKSYGLTIKGDWHDSGSRLEDYKDRWRKATTAEVIEALKKECVKRYGEDWENVKIKVHADRATNHCNHYNVVIHPEIIFNKNGNLFYKGKWAEKLEEGSVLKQISPENYMAGLELMSGDKHREKPELKCQGPILRDTYLHTGKNDQPKPMFADAQVGDSVYDLDWGHGVIKRIDRNRTLISVDFEGDRNSLYNFDGFEDENDLTRSLYWDKPQIFAPEGPKRKESKRDFSREEVLSLIRFVRTFGLPNINSAEKLLDHLLQNIKS